MYKSGQDITAPLTLKYVIALGALAALAVVNFWILRAEIRESEAMASIIEVCGEQRSLIHRTATLAERLVFTPDAADRSRGRQRLVSAIEALEASHHALKTLESLGTPPAQQVKSIYGELPWMLDSELRNYLSRLRALATASNEELSYDNESFRYVREQQTVDTLLQGLDAVLGVYAAKNTEKTARLQSMATWSLLSTLVVLLLDGAFVFRPMVRRVRLDMAEVTALNAMLEEHVENKTAEAVYRTEQLEQSESALRESEALYRSLVDHLPLCVLRKDPHGRITFVNDQYCQLLAKTSSEIVGSKEEDVFPLTTAAKHVQDDKQVLSTHSVLYDVEESRRSDGSCLYFASLTVPLLDGKGEVTGTQTALWDITSRKQAEKRALDSERLAAIGQMVAGVAHESRNALQQIQACIRLLEWESEGMPNMKELICDLQIAQDRLHRLFDDLQCYAAPLKINPRRCRLSEVLAETWRLIEPETAGRDVSYTTLGSDGDEECLVDPFQLQQVFRNILENALAACDDPVVIEVSYRDVSLNNQEAWEITIRDNGPGLSPEQQERIYEPFFTTKTQGTGLGMAIVKRIVDAYGGVVKARNHESMGAEIVITLPSAESGQACATADGIMGAHEHELN